MSIFLVSKNTSYKTAVCIGVKWTVEFLKEVSTITNYLLQSEYKFLD